ncbi:MAG: hypothetical protein JNL62_28090, partial [Bryobacterales bacterium]|nr:hypothetical protein [Bryobacterales bacterium]
CAEDGRRQEPVIEARQNRVPAGCQSMTASSGSGCGKVDNLAVSHFPTAACDDGGSFFFSIPKPKKGTRPLQAILVILFQDQPPLETEPDFRIILGLENAQECG